MMPGLGSKSVWLQNLFLISPMLTDMKKINVYSHLRKNYVTISEDRLTESKLWGQCELIFTYPTPNKHSYPDGTIFEIIYQQGKALHRSHSME